MFQALDNYVSSRLLHLPFFFLRQAIALSISLPGMAMEGFKAEN